MIITKAPEIKVGDKFYFVDVYENQATLFIYSVMDISEDGFCKVSSNNENFIWNYSIFNSGKILPSLEGAKKAAIMAAELEFNELKREIEGLGETYGVTNGRKNDLCI
jgi:hypothetical protein